VKKVNLVFGAGCLLGALQACGSTEHDAPSDAAEPAEFTSSVPADKILESLSPNEAVALCRDVTEFTKQALVREDTCRVAGVLTAGFTAAFSPDATDAELRQACSESFDACMSADASEEAEECDADAFSENCSASVAEYGACLEGTLRAWGQVAEQLPSCDTLSREGLSANSSEDEAFGSGSECEAFQAKCPGIPQATEDFVDAYCARISPCCSDAGVGDDCRSVTIRAVQGMHFDADEAAGCLARLEQDDAEPDFCGQLGQSAYYSEWSAAIPECDGVFSGTPDSAGASGGVPAGGACDWDDDCAALEDGVARCVPTGDGFERICMPTTQGAVGDVCVGTVAQADGGTEIQWVADASATGGALCHRSDNLRCDEQTKTCVATGELGDACASSLECAVDTYCAPGGVCAERLAEGSACNAYAGECAGAGVCDDTTQKCTLPLPAGAACSETNGPPCASARCLDGVCSDPLALLCGER